MRATRFLVIITALALVFATACQGDEVGTAPSTETPTETTTTTIPADSTTTTTTTSPPASTTTTLPLEPIVYLPDVEPDVYQVWNTTSSVLAWALPGGTGDVIGRFASTARDIHTTGGQAEVGGELWVEIDMPDQEPCWMTAEVLVHQITELASQTPARYFVTGLAADGRLNVRVDPGVDHPILTSLAVNTVVPSTGLRAEVQDGTWAQIEYATGKLGWVSFRFLAPEVIHLVDDEPAVYRVTGLQGAERLNVREGPGVFEPVVTSFAADATDILGTGNRASVVGSLWREVAIGAGEFGWVNATYLEIQPPCRPGDGTFCPDNEVTRGMAAAFLSRALGLTDDGGKDWFTDDNGSPFEPEINRLAAAGILQGCDPADPSKVCPNEPASRRIVAVMFSRALGLTDDGGRDWFTDDNGLPGELEINRLAAAGIAQGCTATEFCPADPIVRGQIAAWVDRSFDLPTTDQDFWTDDDGSLFEDAINRITAAGIAHR